MHFSSSSRKPNVRKKYINTLCLSLPGRRNSAAAAEGKEQHEPQLLESLCTVNHHGLMKTVQCIFSNCLYLSTLSPQKRSHHMSQTSPSQPPGLTSWNVSFSVFSFFVWIKMEQRNNNNVIYCQCMSQNTNLGYSGGEWSQTNIIKAIYIQVLTVTLQQCLCLGVPLSVCSSLPHSLRLARPVSGQ